MSNKPINIYLVHFRKAFNKRSQNLNPLESNAGLRWRPVKTLGSCELENLK